MDVDNEQLVDFDDEVFVAKNAGKTLKRFIKSLGKQKYRLALVSISVVIYTVINIFAPLYSAKAVDVLWDGIKEAHALGQSFSIVWGTGGKEIFILFILYISSGALYIFQSFLMASFAEKLSYQHRSEASEKLHRLPLAFFDKHRPGEIMSHITNDMDKMSEALQTSVIRLFTSVGAIVGSIVMMFTFSVTLTLVFLAFVAVSLIITQIASKKILNCAVKRQQAVGKLNGLVEESYSGRMVIKAYNYEDRSFGKIHDAANELAVASQKTDFLMNAINPGIRLVNRCGLVVVAIMGGSLMISGRMTPGIFQAFFQYLNQVGEPITELSFMVSSTQSALASVERIYDLMDEEEMTPDVKSPKIPAKICGNVEFSHVRFGYNPKNILMQDVSFSVRQGQKIAIVGSTGAGKTTLVNLLMRFYEVNGGVISLDGVNTLDMTRGQLRNYFGMVLQDTWLFEGTIAENIAYGKPDASFDEIVAAAKAAKADFFIRTLPDGYNTVLSNDAENISVGQRQLLTIARVFLCDPEILILDEATSSVDTRTEMAIGKAMNALMSGRTSFVIAHRLSTILDADTILFMENGTIIEQGSHKALIEKGGAYSALYNSQFE